MIGKMLRYVIVLVLFNVYYPSTGLPLEKNASDLSIANKLQNLAKNCENSVISELIATQIEPCNISKTSDSKPEFKCLMFYDINSQLCSVFQRSTYDLKSSFTSKSNEVQSIEAICEHAKTWTFAKKEIYPKQKPIDEVFKNNVFCIQMCSAEEVLSKDSNFFCKYYQWGINVIQNQTALIQQNKETGDSISSPNVNQVANNIETSSIKKNESGISSNKSIQTKLLPNDVQEKSPLTSQDTNKIPSSNEPGVGDIKQQVPVDPEKPIQIPNQPNIETPQKNEIEKPPIESVAPNDPSKVEGGQKEAVIDSPKDNPPVALDDEVEDDDPEDYNAGESPEEAVPKLAESDPNLENQEPHKSPNAILISGQGGHNVPLQESEPNAAIPHKNRVSIDSSGPSISETFPNAMQDNFAEDEDHFFPVFLTAIIIVVLLYILYHNKNKFTKVILGLLVEGRQTGRRRNSRGHAYRRLDTLEQAMNTNTAAPPSKIIY